MLGLRVLLWQSDGLEEKALLPQYLVHGNDGPTSQTDFFVDSLLGKHACGRQDNLRAGGGDGLEQRLWGGWHVPVQQRFTRLVEDAKVHGTGV
jgi:hypothetical protein